MMSYWLGKKLGGERRHALVALLVTACGGYFFNYWGEIDTFAPYALIGSSGLAALGLGAERGDWRWFAVAGLLAGLGHLTRSDGLLLLLLVGWLVIAWPWWQARLRQRAAFFAPFTVGYLLVMTPWFIRMLNAVGAPLPLGGLSGTWFAEYNDLFRFPPDFSANEFFRDGFALFLATRWEAFLNNMGTFIALQGFVIMTPLMLIGMWRRRGPFTLAFMLFALGLHAAMTLVFPFPGYRGGLFHGAAALLPWWAAFGVVGLDDVIDWIAARRRHWKAGQAKTIFSAGLVLVAAALTLTVMRPARSNTTSPFFTALQQALPPDARVMLNDPPQLYYWTGLGGVVLPNSPPEVIPEIARRFGVTHLLFYDLLEDESGRVVGASVPQPLWTIFDQPPEFLTPVEFGVRGARLYAITP
jgi:4-amino-4-deoxy-L-arabinose transferase-like glycosyltransferase